MLGVEGAETLKTYPVLEAFRGWGLRMGRPACPWELSVWAVGTRLPYEMAWEYVRSRL